VLEVSTAAKVLPVRILNLSSNHVFIAEIIGMLEIMQTNHKTIGLAGPPCSGSNSYPKAFSNSNQSVALVNLNNHYRKIELYLILFTKGLD